MKNEILEKSREIFKNKTVFITGGAKNCGKTTLLNSIVESYRGESLFARMSIGIDGEGECAVFGIPKPSIFLEENDYVVTTDECLRKSDIVFEYIDVFPYKTALGKIVFARAMRQGQVEIVGPENNSQLWSIIKYIKDYGIKTVFVDGAVNRITQISSFDESAVFVHVFMMKPETVEKDKESIELLNIYKTIPVAENNLDFYYIDGIVTLSKIEKIPENTENIVIEDFTKIFLTLNEFKKLNKKYKVYFKYPLKESYIHINTKDIKAVSNKGTVSKLISE